MIKILKSKIFLIIIILPFFLFYVFNINSNKGIIILNENKKNETININSNGLTIFSNVEYIFNDEKGNNYKLFGHEAYFRNNKPEIINLKKVTAFSDIKKLQDMEISSEEAQYFKDTKNIFFYKNILIKKNNQIIMGDNAKFFFKKNILEVSDNVIIKDNKNIINCDRLIYNLITKNIVLNMKSDKRQVYGKRN